MLLKRNLILELIDMTLEMNLFLLELILNNLEVLLALSGVLSHFSLVLFVHIVDLPQRLLFLVDQPLLQPFLLDLIEVL